MENFEMTDVGEASLIRWSMKVVRGREEKTLSISQKEYALSVLKRFGVAGLQSSTHSRSGKRTFNGSQTFLQR